MGLNEGEKILEAKLLKLEARKGKKAHLQNAKSFQGNAMAQFDVACVASCSVANLYVSSSATTKCHMLGMSWWE